MPRIIIVVVVALATTLVIALGATAQHHGHGSGGHGHRQMQAMLDEIDRVIASGRGAGLAFAADQHGYPGPMHVLELKEQLQLTPAQEVLLMALQHAMFTDSRPKSARLMDAEARLRRLFADGVADEAGVRAAVTEIERARTEVRLVHLLTHLQTRPVLTAEQRRLYHAARWAP
jgi:Spy/CpxP family protein refolding chaperone